MKKSSSLKMSTFQNACLENGFTKRKTNYYRCYGQGLLQVITIPNRKVGLRRTSYNHDVLFGVFSLYAKINWLSSQFPANIILGDLWVTHEVNPTLFGTGCSFPPSELHLMLEAGFPFLNNMRTHMQLSCFLEEYDRIQRQEIIRNDSSKIVPYVLSAQYEKAIDCITTIESQNLSAYQQKSQRLSKYDQEIYREKIERRIFPLIRLRDALCRNDRSEIAQLLLANYQENINMLNQLRIPVGNACVAPHIHKWGKDQ